MKEKIFNYENYIGGVDMGPEIGVKNMSILSPSSESNLRPFSAQSR